MSLFATWLMANSHNLPISKTWSPSFHPRTNVRSRQHNTLVSMAGYQQPTVNEDGEDAATNGHGTAPQPAPAPEPEPAPAAQPSKDFLQLRFVDQNDAEVTFKLKPTTKLKKAMDAYSARAERDRLTLRFMFDGQRIQEETTPADVSINLLSGQDRGVEADCWGWAIARPRGQRQDRCIRRAARWRRRRAACQTIRDVCDGQVLPGARDCYGRVHSQRRVVVDSLRRV